MTRSKLADTPIHAHDLAYAKYLIDDVLTPELKHIASAFYPDALQLCDGWSQASGYSVEQCVAVTALYSINCAWPTNIVWAQKAILHGIHSSFPLVKQHARAILQGEPVTQHLTNGPKVNDFYLSILGKHGCIGAIDRWVFKVFHKRQGVAWYPWVRRALIMLAECYGMDDVSEIQSWLWYAIMVDMARQGDTGAIQSVAMLGLKKYL